MSALDSVFDATRPAGVLAVLDAADLAQDKLADAQWVASFAPPITSYRSCVCGRVMEKRGTGWIDVTVDEKAAAVAEVTELIGHNVLDYLDPQIADRVVAHVIDAINHERAVADADADRDWDDAHTHCEVAE